MELYQGLAMAAGAILSGAFLYVPGLKSWFGKLGESQGSEYADTVKRGVMALLLAVVAVAAYGISCAGWFEAWIPALCGKAGIEQLVVAFILALGANQGTYWALPNAKKRA